MTQNQERILGDLFINLHNHWSFGKCECGEQGVAKRRFGRAVYKCGTCVDELIQWWENFEKNEESGED